MADGQSIRFRAFPPEPERERRYNREDYGPLHMPRRNSTPVTYFYLICSLDLMKEFVRRTNSYAKELCHRTALQTGRHSRKHLWNRVGKLTVTEFKAFLAVLYNMGLNKKATIQEYWNTKNVSQSTPWFRSVFSRNRFQNILKFLHLADNKRIPQRNEHNYSPAARIQPLIDFVNRKFMYYYKPRQELTVDESLVGTKGRSSMIQYIPSKRSRFGVKFWLLCEAVTGYVLQMNIYLGKKFEPATPVGVYQATNVVQRLLSGANLLLKWHHVFTDNFFSTLQLATSLYNKHTFLTGTMRSSRVMPKMIKNANPNPGQEVYARQREKLMCAFKEKPGRKPVRLISTYYNACRALNDKPLIVNAYNRFMGGVDLSDQMMTIEEIAKFGKK